MFRWLYCWLGWLRCSPEELIITRCVNRHAAPRRKLTQQLRLDARLTPFALLTDDCQPGLTFLPIGGETDYGAGRSEVVMLESPPADGGT